MFLVQCHGERWFVLWFSDVNDGESAFKLIAVVIFQNFLNIALFKKNAYSLTSR